MRRFVCAALLVLVLAGCGGDGGGVAVSTLDDTVRAMQPGDEWTYDVTGTYSEGATAVPLSGTYTETVSSQTVVTPQNAVAQVILQSWALTIQDQQSTGASRMYVTQDATGSVWEHGGQDGSGDYWVTQPVSGFTLYCPSPLAQGTSWGEYVAYSNGKTLDANYVVTGTATVTVPAGVYETYVVTSTGRLFGLPATGTMWIAPQAGNWVQQQVVVTNDATGATLDITLKLQSRTRGG